MNQCSRAFVLTGLVVAILLAMHMLPTLYVNDIELRHVNILSDVLPEPYGTDGATAEVVAPPAPHAPLPLPTVTVRQQGWRRYTLMVLP